ncbi:MAG: SAM-dependent methyltransferase [Elusimicrobiota bacterium]|jgi:16S rRNA C1402 (ribose-2'-O) methylase RsmI
MKTRGHTLYLIPWHIGARGDLTLNTVSLARRLGVFLAEEAGEAAEQFLSILRLDAKGREFLTIPPRPDPAFLNRVLGLLEKGDVGLISSGGMPCFADPGGWLVREVRARGGGVTAMAGASGLTTLLALSGFDWLEDPPTRRFSFTFFEAAGPHDFFLETVARKFEPVVVFLRVAAFPKCLKVMREAVGKRPIAAFLDLTKPRPKFPHADEVRVLTVAEWQAGKAKVAWDRVSDMALMIHPEVYRR